MLLLLDGEPAPGLPFLRQLHWIIAADPASEKSVAEVLEAAGGGGATPGELWRHTAPYRGLSAMTESDADFFFGRSRETAKVIGALAAMPDSFRCCSAIRGGQILAGTGRRACRLHAAGLAGIRETYEPWPQMFDDSRRWCFLKLKPGGEPVQALVEPFLCTWQFDAVDPRRAELQSSWAERLLDGKVSLRDLLDATQPATATNCTSPSHRRSCSTSTRARSFMCAPRNLSATVSPKFSCRRLPDPRLRMMMSMRADFFGELQKDEALYSAHRQINVPPLREADCTMS